jgi:hypothetical protein
MQATPQSDTVTPVTVSQFAEFASADPCDPLLQAMLEAATDAVIQYIGRDLVPREWVAIEPAPALLTELQLSPHEPPSNTFDLPYTNLISVVSVTANGGQAMPYQLQPQRRPAKITVQGWDYISDLVVQYVAGTEEIPNAVRTAIMMVAAFLYDHRGGCDAQDGIKKSGAAMLLRSYKTEVTL